jgi:hypothetical protein
MAFSRVPIEQNNISWTNKVGQKISKKITPYPLKIILITFFVVHYGIFMLGHLFFIYFVSFFPYILSHNGYFPNNIEFSYEIFIPFLMLFFSHGFSFLKNFIGQKEYLKISATNLMAAPYGRIILMHITLLLGGFFSVFISITMMALASLFLEIALTSVVVSIFIILKTLIDIKAHLREHSILSYQQESY